MIKAISKAGDLVLLGLSRANCEKLLEGKPILVTPEHLQGLRQAIVIAAGETELDVVRAFAAQLPPGAADQAPPAPGEVVKVTTAEGASREAATDPEDAVRNLADARREKEAREAAGSRGLDLERFKAVGQEIGRHIDGAIAGAGGKGKVGFGLFMFGLGQNGWVTWLANVDRGEAIAAMKEWIAQNEAPPPKARG